MIWCNKIANLRNPNPNFGPPENQPDLLRSYVGTPATCPFL
jgi:hypothetical protein